MTEGQRVQTFISQDLLDRVLAIAGTQTILVGGQALAFWASYYRIDEPVAAISKDADFLGSRNDVDRFATGLNGVVRLPDRRMKSALLGRVEVPISDMEYVHIDVLLEVFGDISQKAIRERSYAATIGTKTFKVMHPLDMLQGRLENVYGIKEKQDEHGIEQLKLAIQVVRAFVLAEASSDRTAAKRSVILKHLNRIERMMLSDAGRKIAKRFGVHVADAMEFPGFASHSDFMAKKLPQIVASMSPARIQELRKAAALPVEPATSGPKKRPSHRRP